MTVVAIMPTTVVLTVADDDDEGNNHDDADECVSPCLFHPNAD